ncbi:hypothetical protein FKR81_14815 [Lentzea tibetensis]|uniref:Uncharacterized protein n=1 Tax=Lentzea tibetensis TaxID=2591470 RepID=A0A563EVG4_9PSEU|nr:hypothetical protein [Lentzea tibetensis]TWP51481.1 hypothetical protein FKR81_14815 [Lentzea tibetensis]
MEGLVLDVGRWWYAGRTSRLVERAPFSEAAAWSTQERGTVYVEGYVLTHDGDVSAAAWYGRDDQVVYGQRASAYLGVPLSAAFRKRIKQQNGTAAVLMSLHAKLLSVLQHGLPTSAVLPGGRAGPRSM